METASFHTLGRLALRLRTQPHYPLRLVKAGKVPFVKVGRYHAFEEQMIPAVKAALEAAGYARPEEVEVATA